MFFDNVKIYVKAGDGGNGAVSFHREKYVSHGGPDGGDGGNGGNIVVVADRGVNTLLEYKYKRKFVAANGGNGSGSKFHGKTAPDLILKVPYGTIIKDPETKMVIKDMSDDQPFKICKGGKGGWGNKHFATPTRQIPRFAKSGTKGEEAEIIFELKTIADVGLIGMPNAGKSSLLASISAARPKIADYKFTTLSPMLGVVRVGDGTGFVAADIPGLIEGAAEGMGLGHRFLRHIERCRLLLHVVDISAYDDPVENMLLINKELEKYDPELIKRPQIIVANKIDAADPESENLDKLMEYANNNSIELVSVSAATGENTKQLINLVYEKLKDLPPITVFETEYVREEQIPDSSFREITVKNVNGVYVAEAPWLMRTMESINFDDRDSLRYFQKILKDAGIIDALIAKGVKDGDTVSIYDFEFDFVE